MPGLNKMHDVNRKNWVEMAFIFYGLLHGKPGTTDLAFRFRHIRNLPVHLWASSISQDGLGSTILMLWA